MNCSLGGVWGIHWPVRTADDGWKQVRSFLQRDGLVIKQPFKPKYGPNEFQLCKASSEDTKAQITPPKDPIRPGDEPAVTHIGCIQKHFEELSQQLVFVTLL